MIILCLENRLRVVINGEWGFDDCVTLELLGFHYLSVMPDVATHGSGLTQPAPTGLEEIPKLIRAVKKFGNPHCGRFKVKMVLLGFIYVACPGESLPWNNTIKAVVSRRVSDYLSSYICFQKWINSQPQLMVCVFHCWEKFQHSGNPEKEQQGPGKDG